MKIINKFSYINVALTILLLTLASCSNLKTASQSAKPLDKPELAKEDSRTQITEEEAEKPRARKRLRMPRIITKRSKVAVLLPLSGPNKIIGQNLLNSITLSLFDHDLDNNIELEVFDSKGTAFGAKSAIKEIANRDIKTVIGPVFSASVEAIAKTVRKNDMIVISFSNNMDLIDNEGIFLMGISPEQQIEKIVTYTISANKKNFSVIAPNNQYGLKIANILKDAAKRKDGHFVSSEFYVNDQNIESAARRVVNSYVIAESAYENLTEDELKSSEIPVEEEDKIYSDVILVPESGNTLSKIVAAINKYNINERDLKIIGSSQWDDLSTLNDLSLRGSWFPAPNPAPYKAFEKKYYQTFDNFPIRISSIAYDAVSVVIELLKETKGANLYLEDFIEYESARNGFVGIDGLFRFLPNGIVQRNLAVLEVRSREFEVIEEPMEVFLKY